MLHGWLSKTAPHSLPRKFAASDAIVLVGQASRQSFGTDLRDLSEACCQRLQSTEVKARAGNVPKVRVPFLRSRRAHRLTLGRRRALVPRAFHKKRLPNSICHYESQSRIRELARATYTK